MMSESTDAGAKEGAAPTPSPEQGSVLTLKTLDKFRKLRFPEPATFMWKHHSDMKDEILGIK